MASCEACGASLVLAGVGRTPKYCSLACRVWAHRRRHGLGREEPVNRDQAQACKHCGTRFELARAGRPRVYCSAHCRAQSLAAERLGVAGSAAERQPAARPKGAPTPAPAPAPESFPLAPSLARLDAKERKLRIERNELSLYIDLLSRAGVNLRDVVRVRPAQADVLQQWARSRGKPEGRPRGLRPVQQWLRSEGRFAPELYQVLADPTLQVGAAKLYRSYRRVQLVRPAAYRLRSGRQRLTTWDDMDAALSICIELRGAEGWSRKELRETTADLLAWRKSPARHRLIASTLHALLPTVVRFAAHAGRRKVA